MSSENSVNGVRLRFVDGVNEMTFCVPRGSIVEYCDSRFISKNIITLRTKLNHRAAEALKELLTMETNYTEFSNDDLNDEEFKQIFAAGKLLGMKLTGGVLPPGIVV